MTKRKTYSLVLLFTIISFMLGSCSKEDVSSLSEPQPLVLQGQIYSFDSEEGTIWNGEQKIGVFLIDSEEKTLLDEYVNLKYFADNRNASGYFVPEGEPVYLEEQQKVNAIAYYPYEDTDILTCRTSSQYLYQMDLSDQKNLKPDAFLYADNVSELSNVNYKATLELRPVLSMVKITFTQVSGLSEERLKKMTLKLKGMPLKADFDLLGGEFIPALSKENNQISIDVKDDLTTNILLYPSELSQNATLEITLPADADHEAVTMTWSLNNAVSSVEENTQYFVLAKVSEEEITGELTGESLIYIQDWNTDADVNGSVTQDEPQPVSLVENGDFESLTNISVSGSVPAEVNVWYGLKNDENFLSNIYKDATQGNVAHMKGSGTLSWYKNYIGHTMTGAEPKSYRLRFKASTLQSAEKANMQVYIRINKSGNYFFVLKDADLTTACAAQVVSVNNGWTEYSIDFDFTQQVNTIWKNDMTISSTTQDDFQSFYVAFVAQNVDVDYYLDNVTLEELNE